MKPTTRLLIDCSDARRNMRRIADESFSPKPWQVRLYRSAVSQRMMRAYQLRSVRRIHGRAIAGAIVERERLRQAGTPIGPVVVIAVDPLRRRRIA